VPLPLLICGDLWCPASAGRRVGTGLAAAGPAGGKAASGDVKLSGLPVPSAAANSYPAIRASTARWAAKC